MTQIETLSQLKKLLEKDGVVTRSPVDMPPQIRRLCPGAEEIAVVRWHNKGVLEDVGAFRELMSIPSDFRIVELVMINDLPAVVMWR